MKRVFLYALIVLGFSTLLVQCVATQKDMEYTNVQMRKVDNRVETIDKEVAELKKQTVQEVRERQAETGDRLDYHQSEILRLQGEIEENGFLIKQLQEDNRELKKMVLSRIETSESNTAAEISSLKERLALSEEQLIKAHDRLAFAETEIQNIKQARSAEAAKRAMEAAERAREAERKARLAAAAEKEKESRSKGPKEILPDTYKVDVRDQNIGADSAEVEKMETKPAPVSAATSTSYENGLTLFKKKKYRDAYNAFAEYLDKNPTGSQAINARFHAAESLYEVNDHELAILEYQKLIVENPKHPLASMALFRQGQAFEKIGDKETARIVYNKLVDTYPGSPEASSAKTRLEALKR